MPNITLVYALRFDGVRYHLAGEFYEQRGCIYARFQGKEPSVVSASDVLIEEIVTRYLCGCHLA